MIGRTISHYRILEKLGEGGMGIVYKAEDTRLRRAVALKFLPDQVPASDDGRARFIREAHAAASLVHPNIATIYEFDEADDQAFIAMEYVEGETLKERIRGQPLSVKSAIDVAIAVVDALAAAHARGIIHRDIKPENIMLSRNGTPKVMDFGLAEIAGWGRVTKTGAAVGTLAYMSPEQVHGEQLTGSTDIWSLGVVLYEALTGNPPFKADNEAALIFQILNDPRPAPSTLDRRIPHQLDAVVMTMLEKDRALRYQTSQDLLAALRAVRSGIEAGEYEAKDEAIAVLPFENISPEPDTDYFSDGLTEELIANLSRLQGVRLVSRTTSMQYKRTRKDIRTIGRELGVRYIVEGSARRFRDDLRITAQLIDVETDAHLWAETYKGRLADVFEIQEQVSRQVVDALRVRLTLTDKVALTKRSTLNAEAFDCYLRGRDFLYRRTKNSIQFALQLFQKATELDPRYAAAYAGLGEAYATLYQGFERKDAWLEKAIEASLKALMYDANLSDAYATLALAYFNKNELDDSLVAAQKAIELDPDNFAGYWVLGRTYHVTDRDREAVDLFKKVLTLNPDFYSAYGDLLIVYERLGEQDRYGETLRATLEFYPRYLSQHPDDARAHIYYAIDLVRAGRLEEAKDELAKALELSPSDPLMTYNAACAYARMGEKRRALDALRTAITTGFEYYEWIERDPDLASIRNEPEYLELLKRK